MLLLTLLLLKKTKTNKKNKNKTRVQGLRFFQVSPNSFWNSIFVNCNLCWWSSTIFWEGVFYGDTSISVDAVKNCCIWTPQVFFWKQRLRFDMTFTNINVLDWQNYTSFYGHFATWNALHLPAQLFFSYLFWKIWTKGSAKLPEIGEWHRSNKTTIVSTE